MLRRLGSIPVLIAALTLVRLAFGAPLDRRWFVAMAATAALLVVVALLLPLLDLWPRPRKKE
jgi:hypothetical protein